MSSIQEPKKEENVVLLLLELYNYEMNSRKEKIELLESLVEEGSTLNQKYYEENKQLTFEEWYCSKLAEEKEVEPKEEDVCCVGCGIEVCGYDEEPPHKDNRDEAVCYECCEDDETTIQYRKEIEEGCPEGYETIWNEYGFKYVEKTE